MTTNKPFFAQLLTAQELTPKDQSAISGGATSTTQIDFKRILTKAVLVTLRYPSDSDGLITDSAFKLE